MGDTMLRKTKQLALLALAILCFPAALTFAQDFHFDSTISPAVLNNYLNRSIHYTELLHSDLSLGRDKRGVDPRENIRALLNMGAKYIGRSIMIWGNEEDLNQYTPWLKNAKRMIDTMHSVDPDIIFEAAEFEIISTMVGVLDVPAAVLQAFGQPVVARKFNYQAMLYTDGKFVNQWGPNNSVPDMSRLETRMYYYFLACNYIDIGVEAFHFGQVGLMDQADPGHVNWLDMLTKVRAYAKLHARRHMALCNAHTHPSSNLVINGKTLFDIGAFPMRIAQQGTACCKGELRVGYTDALFTKSKGGITPSGWACKNLPWLAEFDNYGGGNPGPSSAAPFIWGYDEITFIAIQSEADRKAWLKYAWDWVAVNDTAAHLMMPGMRVLTHGPAFSPNWYWSNTKSAACPKGFNTEADIKEIWGTKSSRIAPRPDVISPLNLHGNSRVAILTLSGRVLKTFTTGVGDANLDSQEIASLQLPDGVYFYSVMGPSGTAGTGKFMVDKGWVAK
ncbi:MAG: hypothetical protein JWO30_4687 [Fibrobacteres bacterium]|nr:hypothetical protein [Fibrobacterota bacterium]